MFLGVGGVSSIATLYSRYLMNFYTPFELAVALSQIIGVMIAFSLNWNFVFARSGAPVYAQFSRFFLVNVLSLAIVSSVSSIAFRFVLPWLGVDSYRGVLAQLIGLGACAVPSFIGHKRFSFRA